MLERFGFTGDRLTARIGDLSGGERRRLQLLRLLLGEPNVLLLDEPTNDLDIETLNVVEDFLDSWPGTLVVVSHDRYFLERVCDRVWALLGDGRWGCCRAASRSTWPAPQGGGGAIDVGGFGWPGAPLPRAAAERREAGGATAQRAAKKELARVERQLAKLAARIDACTPRWPSTAATTNASPSSTPNSRLEAEKDELELAWLEAADQTQRDGSAVETLGGRPVASVVELVETRPTHRSR